MTLPNPALTAVSFAVAVVVGLTGMGGGALMTPILMFFFGIPPLAAVGSDLVVSAVTKPFGAFVHLRKRTADLRIAGLMCAGSVPFAFSGVFLARLLGDGNSVQEVVAVATGVVLLVAAAAIGVKAFADARPRASMQREAQEGEPRDIAVRPILTILVGIITGLGVGMTSVGSGSLVIVALTALYPRLPVRRMVGTDLAQAVPMAFAAACAHLIAGDVRLDVTTALLVGGIPGVIAGSVISSRARSQVLRPILAVILLASGLKLVNVSLAVIALSLVCGLAVLARWRLFARRRARAGDGAATRAFGAAERQGAGTARRSP